MQSMSPPPWIVEYQKGDIVYFLWNDKNGRVKESHWDIINLQLDECENE
ncbi:MAG: hypothetical protein ACRCVU_13825 [Flavobacterium sp.]